MLDAMVGFLFLLFNRKDELKRIPLREISPQRIVVIESHLIGDVVMAIPALSALRRRFPLSVITLVGGDWAEELLANQHLVDRFMIIRFPWATYDFSLKNIIKMLTTLRKIRSEQWDLGIDLRGDFRNIVFLYLTKAFRRVSYDFTGGGYLLTDIINDEPSLTHLIDHHLNLVKQLGCSLNAKEPEISVSEMQIQEACAILELPERTSNQCIIGIHPGASQLLKQWKLERFASLADQLIENSKFKVIFFAGPREKEVMQSIITRMHNRPFVVSQPLSIIPALFKLCNVFLGVDSGAVHIAAAVGIPTIVLFGPVDPNSSKPMSPKTTIIIKEGYSCRPCDLARCVQPNNNCMDALEVVTVYKAILLVARQNGFHIPLT